MKQNDDGKGKSELDRFKQIIGELMPSLEEKYDQEYSYANGIKQVQMIVGVNDTNTMYKIPKKKFVWNDPLRDLLVHLIKKRSDCYKVC